MMSVDAIRLPAMAAHSFFGEGPEKLRANRQHLTKVAEYLSGGREHGAGARAVRPHRHDVRPSRHDGPPRSTTILRRRRSSQCN